MDIALIHPNLGFKGGLETRLYNYMHFFLRRGDRVTIIAAKIHPDVHLPEEVRIIKFDQRKIPKPLRMYFFNRSLKRLMDTEKFGFSLSLGRTGYQDAVLCPGNHLGYLKAMNVRVKKPVDWMNIRLDRKAFQNSRVVLAASAMIKREVVELYDTLFEAKTKVLYPPLDTSRFNQDQKERTYFFRKKFGFEEEHKIVLFPSTSHKRKNLKLVVDALDRIQVNHPELRLAIVGEPSTFSRPYIQYLGFTDQMEQVYTMSNVTVLPSLYEPFGQVVTESVACGTPVVISHMTAAKEVISVNEGIVVNDFLPDSWANAIEKAMQHPFNISPDFAVSKGLDLSTHMERLLQYAGITMEA